MRRVVPLLLAASGAALLGAGLMHLRRRRLLDAPSSPVRALPSPAAPSGPSDDGEAPPLAGARASVAVLDDNVDAWVARWRLVQSAKTSIDFATYILTADVYGMSFLGALLDKAKKGVRVRVLLDATGTLTAAAPKLEDATLKALAAAGVDVRVYNRMGPAAVKCAVRNGSALPLAACSHEKILVVDERIGITGGRNVADEYFAHPDDDAEVFLDREVVIDGADAVRGLVEAFEREHGSDASAPVDAQDAAPAAATVLLSIAADAMDRWLREKPLDDLDLERMSASPDRLRPLRHEVLEHLRANAERMLRGDDVPGEQRAIVVHALHEIAVGLTEQLRARGAARRPSPKRYDAAVRVLGNCSRAAPHDDEINRELLRLVRAARRRIVVQSPYVVLVEPALAALEDASRRGVEIVLLTNSPMSTDNPPAQAVFLDQWRRLLARLPTLRMFVVGERHNIHGKSAVFDDEVAVVGSYNMDVISAALNGEVVAVLRGPEVVAAIRDAILARVRYGAPRVVEYRVDPRTGEAVFGPRDHVDPRALARVRRLRPAARLLAWLPKLARP